MEDDMSLFYVSINRLDLVKKNLEGVRDEIDDALRLMGEFSKDETSVYENNAFLEQRRRIMHELPQRLERILPCRATVIFIEETDDYKNFDGETVIRGSRVTIRRGDEEPESYDILGSYEADPLNGILSCDCALAKALIGAKKGSEIPFNDQKVVIMEVERI
jgi:transcription elongation GreA/GreB family factor